VAGVRGRCEATSGPFDLAVLWWGPRWTGEAATGLSAGAGRTLGERWAGEPVGPAVEVEVEVEPGRRGPLGHPEPRPSSPVVEPSQQLPDDPPRADRWSRRRLVVEAVGASGSSRRSVLWDRRGQGRCCGAVGAARAGVGGQA